jgi:AraC family transcriptional regulator, transcriptional activator of pobA
MQQRQSSWSIIESFRTIFGTMALASRLASHRGGVPIYEYRTDLDTPPVALVRNSSEDLVERGRHIHDFPLLWYDQPTGHVYVVAAGEVIDPAEVGPTDHGVGVLFDQAALGADGRSPWPAWRSHPLLFPFLHGQAGGILQLTVPAERRPVWDMAIASIESELAAQREGFRQAALAHLTLLLIDVARMAADVVGDLRRSGEPLLADVFDVIDRRHTERLSLRDVADELGITAGHLTTVVRRRTGRTVQEWIIERRMAEARSLLTDTDLPVGEVARRVGMSDQGYFGRMFRRTHGVSPRSWRSGATRRARG